jgi:hypothetical protein
LYRSINESEKVYQPRINIIKDENSNLLIDPHSVLNVHLVHDVRQTDIHMAEPLVPEPSHVRVEIAVEKLKRYKSLGTDQIPAKLIKVGGETLCSEIQKLILQKIKSNCHSSGRYLLLYQFTEWVIRWTVITIEASPSYQLPTKFYTTFFW